MESANSGQASFHICIMWRTHEVKYTQSRLQVKQLDLTTTIIYLLIIIKAQITL